MQTENVPQRITKLMSQRGICSRREAEEFIDKGWVFVDGVQVTEQGTKALPNQSITLSGSARTQQNQKVTILLNKPIGYVSGQPEEGYEPAVKLITDQNRDPNFEGHPLRRQFFDGLAPAGRLDIDSKGLLIFTQDGRMVKQLIGEDGAMEKEYLVRVSGPLNNEGLKLLNFGLTLDDKPLKQARVEWLNEDQLRFILKEGRKRQIRRMCELVGLKVIGLKRVRVGNIKLGKLAEGQWRFLAPNETF